MKKSVTLLLLLSLLCAIQLQAQTTRYYTAPNGDKWGFQIPTYSDKAILMSFQANSSFTGALEIPNTVTDDNDATVNATVGSLGSKLFEGNTAITSFTIPTALTEIGVEAFANCTNLSGAINIPPSVIYISPMAFSGCMKITDVTWTKTDKSTETIYCWGGVGGGAFSNSGIRSFKLTTTTGNPYIGNADFQGTFSDCPNLEFIDFSIVGPTSGVGFTIKIYNASHVLAYMPSSGIFHNYTKPTVNFIEGGVCKHFSVQDNYSMRIPYAFTAQKITYDSADENTRRTFSGTSCKTLCLPYSATLPDGMRAYELTRKNTVGRNSFIFVPVGDGGTKLDANKPYLVRITDGAASKQFSEETGNITIAATPATMEVQATADGNTYFGGTTVAVSNEEAAAKGMYNLSNNAWYRINTSTPSGSLHQFRAYIRTTGGTPAKSFALVLDDNNTTDIDAVEQTVEHDYSMIYTLDGKPAGIDMDKLKSGEVYVRNGKKFYKF